MEGVVFLDRQDRQKILLRSTGRVVSLNQCGVSVAKRFTFYDQVHTTGMDIKQPLNAQAILTLGKDMPFRDSPQSAAAAPAPSPPATTSLTARLSRLASAPVRGAYRMRGIGRG